MDPNIPEQNSQEQTSFPLAMLFRHKLLFLIVGGILFLLMLLLFSISLRSISEITSFPTPTPVSGGSNPAHSVGVTTSPAQDEEEADYTGDITMTFISDVSVDTVHFSLTPSVEGTLTQVSPRVVSFKPRVFLKQSTKFTAKLDWKNASGVTNNYSWSFTTDHASGEESASQTDAAEWMKIRAAADKAYQKRKQEFPFLTKLPYVTNHFKIEITQSDTILVTTYGKTPDQTNLYQQEARDWLKANGGNLGSLSIKYQSSS